MTSEQRIIIGIGELLWDLMPAGPQLGGAPFNFVYHANALGHRSIIASRIGDDEPGRQALDRLQQLDIETSYVQLDGERPTGTVQVQVDEDGQPRYTIAENVAWDYLEMSPRWRTLAAQADAICFGSLAQRSPQSRRAIREFLQAARSDALIIFDVNLRQSFYSRELLSRSLGFAKVVKLNHAELPIVTKITNLGGASDEDCARQLLESFDLELVCVTRGSKGSLMLSNRECVEHPGFKITVADTVGAGDAFTAALAHYYLMGESLEQISEQANRLGAWVASQIGATPKVKRGDIIEIA